MRLLIEFDPLFKVLGVLGVESIFVKWILPSVTSVSDGSNKLRGIEVLGSEGFLNIQF